MREASDVTLSTELATVRVQARATDSMKFPGTAYLERAHLSQFPTGALHGANVYPLLVVISNVVMEHSQVFADLRDFVQGKLAQRRISQCQFS